MKKYLLTATVMIGALLFAACGNTNKEADKKRGFDDRYDFLSDV